MTPRLFRKHSFPAVFASIIMLTLAFAAIVATALLVKSWYAVGAASFDWDSHRVVNQARRTAIEHLPTLPLSFEANFGQFDHGVKFFARADGYDVCLTATEAVIRLRTSEAADSSTLRMKLKGANPSPVIKGRKQQPGGINYLIGADARRWRRNVPHFARVEYSDVYPGIGLAMYGNHRSLEYDWMLAPGANPNAIKLEFTGARSLRVENNGDLVISASNGEVRQLKPVAYQRIGGRNREVAVHYSINSDNQIGFVVGEYDTSHALVIDPVLSYSAVVGATYFADVAADAAGNVYLFGITSLPNFPVTAGAYRQSRGSNTSELFVAKLNPDGASFAYATYLGGNGYSFPKSLAVDAAGNAYVCAFTAAPDMPTTPGAFQRNFAGPGQVGSGLGGDAYLAKLSADGSSLGYATYLGGSQQDDPFGVAVDQAGNAYIIGFSSSANFPTTAGSAQPSIPAVTGGSFITKFNAAGSALIYSTYLKYTAGAALLDSGSAVAVDANQNAYVAGIGGRGAFVTKLNSNGTSFLYRTALNTVNSNDQGFGIAADNSGQAYVTGKTKGAGFSISPVVFQSGYGGGASDAFVAKLNPNGGIAFASFLGGSGDDEGKDIAIDPAGNVVVTGWTTSANFPVTPGVFQPNPAFTGNSFYDRDAFVAKISGSGNAISYSTYLGGNGSDEGLAISAGETGQIYLAGTSGDTSGLFDLRFPSTPGVLSIAAPVRGVTSGFVAKIDETRASAADLEMAIRGNGDFYTGAVGSLVFKVTNAGSTNTTGQTKVVYRPPAGFEFQSAASSDWNCPKDFLPAGNLVCIYTTPLAPGESASFFADFRISATGSTTNTAKVTNGSDTNPANDTATDTTTIKQGCSGASFASTTPAVGSEGGNFTVQFRTQGECNWSAVGSFDWIKINSGGGDGGGPISFSISPNPATSARTGLISAGGRSLIITQGPRVTITSAASFKSGEMASDAIATAFGFPLATDVAMAQTTPLPISLLGTTVKVKDSAGVEQFAPLFFVFPQQVNFHLPPSAAVGEAIVTIASGNGAVSAGSVQIVKVAPGLFSVDATGRGYAAGVILRIKADGSQSYESLAFSNNFVIPIDLGPPSDQVFLILFGTGIRGNGSLSNISATIGGESAEVLYAGPQGDFIGLDQVNVRLPRNLAGRGQVDVVLAVDGKTANSVRVNVK
ncbi:MAG: SBBP repeat-containing protein [Acidobacteriota bacterium]